MSISNWRETLESNENHSKHFLSTNIWDFKESKSALSLVIKINQLFHQKLFSWTAAGAFIWLRQFLHWFDHQTKPSIPFPYYLCIPLYRSACIAATVLIFLCIEGYSVVYCVFKNCFLVTVYCIWLIDIVLKLFVDPLLFVLHNFLNSFHKNYSFSKQFAKIFKCSIHPPPSWTWPSHILQLASELGLEP